MKIRVYRGDFNSFGMAYIGSNAIAISINTPAQELFDTFIHECAHIISRSLSHDGDWLLAYRRLGGKKTKFIIMV